MTTSGSPPTATISKDTHRMKALNYVIPVVRGTSATTVAYNVDANLNITIYTGAAATVEVHIG